jgi:hypothetical protein
MKNLILLTIITPLLGACATKGAKSIYAFPQPSNTRTAPNQEFLSPNRVKPGEIMDPEVLTYAQVPSRIIYLPGGQTLFSRHSSSQAVAYTLEPVGISQPPTLANPTPTPKPQAPTNTREVFKTAFIEEDGAEVQGTARRLGILGKSEVEKERAELLLREKETLRWSAEAGWVGFLQEKKTQPIPSKAPPLEIKEDIESLPVNVPEILGPKKTTTPPALETPEFKTPPANPNSALPEESKEVDKEGTGLEIEF